MRTTLEPRLLDPAGHEPGLVVDLRDERRSLLFDLGELDQLASRTLLRTSHAFVSHTHMDHFAGFDHWLALCLGRVSRLVLWGGPGFVDQVGHKLAAYTWNVVHRYEPALRIEVHAFEGGGRRRHACFDSRNAFRRQDEADTFVDDAAPLLDGALFSVRATLVDHEMPVLAFAIDEKAQLRVRGERIAALGLTPGAWLRTLKAAVLTGAPDDTPIRLDWRDAQGEHVTVRPLGELRPLVLDRVRGRRIGYVTDLRFTAANRAALQHLLAGVDLLFIEAVFAQAECDHAARKNHLTARQAGTLAAALGARHVVPFHFSPRYRGRSGTLVAEVHAARAGTPVAVAPHTLAAEENPRCPGTAPPPG